jgi:hypothetical protein
MDVKVEVLIEHICNRSRRWVFPGEVIDISRGEFQKRSKHPRNALVRRFVGPEEVQVVGPTENQALELPETKEEPEEPVGEIEVADLTVSALHQMRKAELKALAEENGILVEEDTKQEIIDKLLEENTDGNDGDD